MRKADAHVVPTGTHLPDLDERDPPHPPTSKGSSGLIASTGYLRHLSGQGWVGVVRCERAGDEGEHAFGQAVVGREAALGVVVQVGQLVAAMIVGDGVAEGTPQPFTVPNLMHLE